MKTNCFNGDLEHESNFLFSPALGNQLQHFPLPGTKVKSSRSAGRIPKPLQTLVREPRTYIDTSVQGAIDSLKKLFRCGGLQDISTRSRVKRRHQVRRAVVHGHE